MSKRICLITPGHLATDPRLVKEAVALSKSSYSVHIIFSQYMPYLIEEDFKILNNHNWTYDCINWSNNSISSKIHRFTSGLLQKLASKYSKFPSSSEFIVNRHFLWQLRKAINCKAEIYIAHNLGALPIACRAAKTNQKKVGFDAEDFHRNETTDDSTKKDYIIKAKIEDKYLPTVNYITAASPLIGEEYNRLYNIQVTTILNVFPKLVLRDGNFKNEVEKKLNLFWFSQTIGKNRGLEDIIAALNILNNPLIELHLLGNIDSEGLLYFKKLVTFNKNNIYFHKPVSPEKLFDLSSQYDIGLASEPGFCFNNKIALSNKIFTYLQAGNALIYSSTLAQEKLLKQYHEIGFMYTIGDIEMLSRIISYYFLNRVILKKHKENAFTLGQNEFNWEKEQVSFIEIINSII